MGFADKAKDMLGDAKETAEGLAKEHGDKIDGAIDKATEFVTDKTPDSVDDKVRAAAEKAKDAVDQLEGEPDTPHPPSAPN
ncbi:antitoxin [Euzebya tangerina]|uniref:antitoxin n=1 Tax=Euzebya tangerina TaxID=591198 RepID=UPI000E312726|nr:antitoxin [Euzebya tangerina]